MVRITAEMLGQLANLSALELSAEETDALAADIEKIIGYIDQMNEIDTDAVEPTCQVTELKNVWREDEVDVNLLSGEELLKMAGDNVTSGQIKVPKVL